jgi:hypothetical protein
VNSTQEQWELIDGLYHCHRHNSEPFERGEACHACTSDPGPRIDVIAALAADTEARAAEAEVRSVAKVAKRTAEELLEGDNKLERVTSTKFFDIYLKSMRLWREMRTARIDKEFEAGLVQHDRQQSGLRGPN